jgi:hypothetical protein
VIVEPTKMQVAAMQTYASALREIKTRLEMAERLITGDAGNNSHLTKEFCYLQLRMVCELIALACLAAHGDIKETNTNSFKKEYSAPVLMKLLSDLHPEFYPQPIILRPAGYRNWEQEKITSGYLTRKDLKKLNGECGDVLHRSSLKKYLSGKAITQRDFPMILAWHKKIVRLLDTHQIMLRGEGAYIFCKLVSPSSPKNVWVCWAGLTT